MMLFLEHISKAFLLVFATLFPILNPPGSALLFLAITHRESHGEREHLARQIAMFASILILVSLSIGSYVLILFGISVPVLRVAGGIVVAMIGWQMLSGTAPPNEATTMPSKKAKDYGAFYPLTMPLTAGPGTIAACIALGTARPAGASVFGGFVVGGLLAVVALALLIYFCYRYSDRIERVLGAAGSEAFSRLFAFILLCIGVQAFWNGFSELLASVPYR
jgi:multiple antibiotic resistance protein